MINQIASSIKRSRIVVIVQNKEFLRNYIESESFLTISENHNLSLIMSPDLMLDDEIKNIFDKIHLFSFAKYPNSFNYIFFADMIRYRNRHLSKSFKFRDRRVYPFFYFAFKGLLKNRIGADLHLRCILLNLFTVVIKHNFWIDLKNLCAKYTLKYLKRLLSFLPFLILARMFMKVDKSNNKALENLLTDLSPDVVLYPTNAIEPLAFDLINICKKLKITSFYLIDNWDNLTSKTLFWKKPDYIGVWGYQTALHAVQVQHFCAKQIFIIGSARFSNYKKIALSASRKEIPDKYILFVGTVLYFNETAALKKLDVEIENNPEIYSGFKVIYRPHPESNQAFSFREKDFKHIILDPQIQNVLLGGRYHSLGDLTLDYYPSLLGNTKFVVGGLTSMLLEASIFGKSYLALVYPEKKNVTSPELVWKNYLHFEGIERLPNLHFCFDLLNLDLVFRKLFIYHETVEARLSTDYFVLEDVKNYNIRLNDSLSAIILEREL